MGKTEKDDSVGRDWGDRGDSEGRRDREDRRDRGDRRDREVKSSVCAPCRVTAVFGCHRCAVISVRYKVASTSTGLK